MQNMCPFGLIFILWLFDWNIFISRKILILKSKNMKARLTPFEVKSKIVYKLYDLTEDAIKIVSGIKVQQKRYTTIEKLQADLNKFIDALLITFLIIILR